MLRGKVHRLGKVLVKSHVPGRLRLALSHRHRGQALTVLAACQESGLVTAVVSDPRSRSVLVQYDRQAYSKHDLLVRLLHLLENGVAATARPWMTGGGAPPPEEELLPAISVRCDLPGRLRLCHPLLRRSVEVGSSIRFGLMNLEGVRRFKLRPETASVVVDYQPELLSRQDLVDSLLRFLVRGRTAHEARSELQASPVKVSPPLLQLTFSTSTLAVALASSFWFPAMAPVALAGTLVAALHTLAEGVVGLVRRRRPTVDTLDSTVIAIGLYHHFTVPVAFMVWLLNLSELLLEATYRESKEFMAGFMVDQSQTVRCLVDGHEQERMLSELAVGDLVAVWSGEQIPVDGVIVAGEGLVDQSVLTGEYAPVGRVVGEPVYAKTVLLAGQLSVRVERSGQETYAAGIMRILDQSLNHRVALQTSCEELAEQIVIPTYCLGGAARFIAGNSAMLAVLNADLGTGIRIAGPTAMLSSISAALEHGILVKDGGVLERLYQTTVIVFDKTGTLTEVIPTVRQVVSFDAGWDERQLLASIAMAEQRFDHPIAKAILREAAAWGLPPARLVQSEYQIGLGIELVTGDGLLRVGSRRYLESQGIGLGGHEERLAEQLSAAGSSYIFAALDDRVMGLVELEATARPEAEIVISSLREQRGLREIYLVSGDHEAATAQLAGKLGIDRYVAGILPGEKVDFVRGLQERGEWVTMLGDGVNDSAALSQADCGISLRGGADAAIDAADIVLMDGRIRNLELLLGISENLQANVRTSFRLLVSCNGALMLGALTGHFGLTSSIVINNALNLVATLNGFRAQTGLTQPSSRKPSTTTSPAPSAAPAAR